jgi:hypothetical protein
VAALPLDNQQATLKKFREMLARGLRRHVCDHGQFSGWEGGPVH